MDVSISETNMKRRKTRRTKARAQPQTASADLDVSSRALLDEREAGADSPLDASIEDPLQDWTDPAGGGDRWLDERSVEKDPERQR